MEALPLRDIHLPGAVSWWPLAPGWWMLVVLLGVAAGLLLRAWLRQSMRRRALGELDAIEAGFADHGNATRLVQDVSALLRRVCLTYRPRTSVASLTGKAWRDALRGLSGDAKALPDTVAWQIVHGPYNPAQDVDPELILKHTRRYLGALPPLSRAA